MAEFELRINTDNAAFEGDLYPIELEAIFRRVVEQVQSADYLEGKWSNVRDSNGNAVGSFRITPDASE